MKRMLINATQKEELRVALVDGQRLYDLDIETISNKQKKANIYKGRITRIEPSLEAAFVDYGAERHGFLPLKEIAKTYFSGATNVGNNGKPDYKKLIKEGQPVMVQVDKEERGNKGAALTTYISLAGRYLVVMPNNPRGGGVSRRIQGDERKELRQTMDKVNIPEGVGVIIRTAGVDRSEDELNWDLNYQMQVWNAISNEYENAAVGTLLYKESNIIVRALRDYFRDDIVQIIIDNENVYQQAKGFMSLVMPDKLKRLSFYQDELPLFTRYQIEAQIDSAYGRNVRLPSGGELVIDYTEAMVSIDINSARATKGTDVEETAFNTNLEAAEEIARQLRLRDIGGLIVIDFIDMYEARHRRQVEDKIRDAIHIDRARVQLARISKFGLLEMSRQRLRPSIDEASHIVCPRCKGQGSIRSTQSVALSVLRLIEEDAMKENTQKIVVQLPVKVAIFLSNEKRAAISAIEKSNNVSIVLIANESLDTPNFDIQRLRHDDEASIDAVSYKLSKDFRIDEDALAPQQTAPAVEEPAVSNIQPADPLPKSKTGFFKLIKQVLGIGSATAQATKRDEQGGHGNSRQTTKKNQPASQQTSQQTSRGKSANAATARKPRQSQDKPQEKTQGNAQDSAAKNDNNTRGQNTSQRASQSGNSQPGNNARRQKTGQSSDRQPSEAKSTASSRPLDEQTERQAGKQAENKAENQAPKQKQGQPERQANRPSATVNPHMKDKSLLHAGRPVSEDAVRGSGKANFAGATNQAAISTTEKAASKDDDKGDNKGNDKDAKTTVASNTSANAPANAATNAALASERVYVPRAINDAVPAMAISDDMPEEVAEGVAEGVTTSATAAPTAVPNTGNRIADLSAFGQSIWLDNINRDMLETGELTQLIAEDDLRGITSNPAIFEKALASNHPGYLEQLKSLVGKVSDPNEAFFALAVKDIQTACHAFKATYERTGGNDGMVSLEVSPNFAYDADKTIEQALILQHQLNAPNAMIKVPGTQPGLVAIEQLTYLGLNINVTLLFSVSRYVEVFEAYMRGLQKRAEMGLPVDNIRSVASFFVSRIDAAADTVLEKTNPEIMGKVAIANAKVAYNEYERLIQSKAWQRLALVGAKPQRLLWASTSTKNPAYPEVLYVDQLIGPDTVNTLPPNTYAAFKAKGSIANTLTQGVSEARALIELLPQYGVDLDLITQKLERDGVQAFEQSFAGLLAIVAEKMGSENT
ncbi:transaldolase [Ostreibacterium oceani]|uniref:Multifunctional fusion protein n=1 Tax=Ostreibacterium oceani TaxID=2654998 RepID=A0A6N7EZI7_9GAMM|nr:transaldolase [Ostreibacterium oceani]MPV86935.1 transaldolase [Ostreibacterium oceani]